MTKIKKIIIFVLSFFMLATFGVNMGFCITGDGHSYDPRKYGLVPEVKNQGNHQTCWAFSTTTAMESSYINRTSGDLAMFNKYLGNDSTLSTFHLAWFAFKNPDKKKNFAYVRNGSVVEPSDNEILNHPGNVQMALSFLTRHDGPVRESALPYGSAYPAAGTSPRDYPLALRLVHATYIESAILKTGSPEVGLFVGKTEMIKLVLAFQGAVSAGVYWEKNCLSSNFAYYNPVFQKNGHAVTIIGWDDNYPRENFQPIQPENNGAWLVQNSWGKSWGDNGYFWMSFEQPLRYAMGFDVEEVNPNVREYYHDDLGFTHEISFPHVTEQAVGVANVFKVKGDHEKLREIGFYSTNSTFLAGTLVLDLGTNNSLANFSRIATQAVDEAIVDESKFLDIFEGIADKGYLVNLLNKPVALTKDHYFAILTIMIPSNSSGDFNPSVAAEVKIPNYRTANAEVNAQETYFSTDGDNWHDGKYHNFLVNGDEITGFNACIKGFSYVPDARFADDWTLISSDGKAQLSISLLKENEPKNIIVKGSGIENILHKVELENSNTGDAKGNFYTLKLICDLKSYDAKLTSLKIDGTEYLTSIIRNIKYKSNPLSEDLYINISKTGVSFKDMTQASGIIEPTDGYTKNSDNSSGNDNQNNSATQSSSSGGGGGGCNSEISVLSLVMLSAALIFRKKQNS